MRFWIAVIVIILSLLIAPGVYAETLDKLMLNRFELLENGLVVKNFNLSLLSSDGEILLGLQWNEDLNLRKEGKVYSLKVFHFNLLPLSLKSIDTIELPVFETDQLAFDEVNKRVIVIGNRGSKILDVNLNDKSCKVLFEYEKGKPGFRCEPLAWWREGVFYLYGYFYDQERYAQGDYIVSLDFTKKGVNIFTKVIDMDELIKKLGEIKSFYLLPPNEGYFEVIKIKGKENNLVYWKDNKVTVIDKGTAFPDIAGTSGKVLYSIATNRPGKSMIKLSDLDAGKSWDLGEGSSYSFISENGDKIIVTSIDYKKQRMSFSFGLREEDYKLKPLLEEVKLGTFKFSADGNVFAYLNEDGITVGKVK